MRVWCVVFGVWCLVFGETNCLICHNSVIRAQFQGSRASRVTSFEIRMWELWFEVEGGRLSV